MQIKLYYFGSDNLRYDGDFSWLLTARSVARRKCRLSNVSSLLTEHREICDNRLTKTNPRTILYCTLDTASSGITVTATQGLIKPWNVINRMSYTLMHNKCPFDHLTQPFAANLRLTFSGSACHPILGNPQMMMKTRESLMELDGVEIPSPNSKQKQKAENIKWNLWKRIIQNHISIHNFAEKYEIFMLIWIILIYNKFAVKMFVIFINMMY